MMNSGRNYCVAALLLAVMVVASCGRQVNYNVPPRKYKRVYTGLENFIENDAKKYRGKRAAVVTNHSGVDYHLRTNIDLIRSRGIEIALVLAPEHGLYGYQNEYDSRLCQSDDGLNAIVYNMHHCTPATLRYLFRVVDIVIFDIQDMGLRCYTYISSLKMVMDALCGSSIELIVLDRPNPIGFLGADGPFLNRDFYSRHVSAFPATFMYNMTIGEAAAYYRGEFAKDVKLCVVPLKNYRRDLMYNESMLPWIPPSPNLPTYESSIVYASIVFMEGINISVGRGTTKPFEYIGAPWLDPAVLCDGLNRLGIKNFKFRPIYFNPTFSKYKGERCGGVQIFYVGGEFSPLEVSYAIISHLKKWPWFRWEQYGGQYSVDFLAGTDLFRKSIDAGRPYRQFQEDIKDEMKDFNRVRSKYLIY